MRKISVKRQKQQQEYSKLRVEYLEGKVCEVCYNIAATEVHHKMGRSGELLNEVKYWLPICRKCHEKVTIDSKWAIENGYSIKRIT